MKLEFKYVASTEDKMIDGNSGRFKKLFESCGWSKQHKNTIDDNKIVYSAIATRIKECWGVFPISDNGVTHVDKGSSKMIMITECKTVGYYNVLMVDNLKNYYVKMLSIDEFDSFDSFLNIMHCNPV